MVCRLYHSGLVNLGWPKDMVRSTKRTLAKSAVEAVRTHKRKTLPSSRLTPLPSLARSQWMWPSLLMLASVSTSSVVFREQRRVHRSRSSARACSQTSLCTRRAQFVLLVVLTIGSAEVVWASKACTHLAKGSHIKGAAEDEGSVNKWVNIYVSEMAF